MVLFENRAGVRRNELRSPQLQGYIYDTHSRATQGAAATARNTLGLSAAYRPPEGANGAYARFNNQAYGQAGRQQDGTTAANMNRKFSI